MGDDPKILPSIDSTLNKAPLPTVPPVEPPPPPTVVPSNSATPEKIPINSGNDPLKNDLPVPPVQPEKKFDDQTTTALVESLLKANSGQGSPPTDNGVTVINQSDPPPGKPKIVKSNKSKFTGIIIGVIVLLVLLIPVGVFYITKLNNVTNTQSKAANQCGGPPTLVSCTHCNYDDAQYYCVNGKSCQITKGDCGTTAPKDCVGGCDTATCRQNSGCARNGQDAIVAGCKYFCFTGQYCEVSRSCASGSDDHCSCGGGGGSNPTDTPNPTNTTAPSPTPGACKSVQIYQGKIDITAGLTSGSIILNPGDQITVQINSPANATAAHVRIRLGRGGQWSNWSADIGPDLAARFAYDYTIPAYDQFTGDYSVAIEAETKVGNVWQ